MKNAQIYQKKAKKILGAFSKKPPDVIDDMDQAISILIKAVLLENSTMAKARTALEAICEEYVDFNDLRVSPAKEIHDCIGKDYPHVRVKAHALADVLREIFYRTSRMSLDYVAEMPKRDRPRRLKELGLSSFAVSMIMLEVFAMRAVPVDQDLADCLEMNGCVPPGSTPEQVTSFMGNLASAKDCFGAHLACRQYVEKSAKALAKWRKVRQAEIDRLEAIALAKAEKEAQAKADAKAKVKDTAKAKAKAARKKASAAKKKAEKKKVKKAAKKTAKKAAKKTAEKKVAKKKAVKKKTATKKVVKKSPGQAAKKTVEKPATKARGKKAAGTAGKKKK